MAIAKNTIRVGVVRGGPSSEYEVSLKTGEALLRAIREQGYQAIDVFVSQDGVWHVSGFEIDPYKIGSYVDLVWNALHGEYGEDGTIQSMLEHADVPFVGSNSFSSHLTFSKSKTKDRLKKIGIQTPKHLLFTNLRTMPITEEYIQQMIGRVVRELHGGPWVVKPNASGSSVLTFKANSHADLKSVFQTILKHGVDDILVEEFISGREATVGVINNFRYQEVYTLPVTEIRKHSHDIWGHKEKYGGSVEEICPGRFAPEEHHQLEELASLLHREFELESYSRSDFMICPRRGIYVLEINSLPGLTSASVFPKSIEAVGATMAEFVNHVIEDTLIRKFKIR